MAIQLDISNSPYGVPFAGAYFRIVTVATVRLRTDTGPKFETQIDVAGYATAAPGDDTRTVDFRRYTVDTDVVETQDGANFLAKCYTWVMAQPDMSGSSAV